MDNPLTPKKIQRLIHLAEDRSFNMERRMLLTEEDVKLITTHAAMNKSSLARYESSSGILDLEHVEAFGESGIGNMSLSKSSAFNPGEITGRSTGADDAGSSPTALAPPQCDDRRRSLALENFTTKLDKQTAEVNDIMRHSIASNYSFHSKRDLTADEVSLIAREAPIPVQQSLHSQFPDSISMNSSNLSVGAYFKTRCPEFGRILGKTDSPDKSMMPSITEVSSTTPYDNDKETNQIFTIDDSLDCVPVRQPRPTETIIKHVIQPKPTNLMPKLSTAKMEPPKVQRVEPSVSKMQVHGKNLNPSTPGFPVHKSFMGSSKPTDVLLKNLHQSFRLMTDDTEGSVENSFSLSKIADYLGKQSNVSVSDMMKLNSKKPIHKKPLSELNMNTQERKDQEVQVTYLKDTKKTETASSAGTMSTVISLDKLKIKENVYIPEIPEVIVTNDSLQRDTQDAKSKSARSKSPTVRSKSPTFRSKSPTSKSASTLSTVRDNFNSFKSGDSPLRASDGEANRSKIPSPNVDYKELDKSVDWQDVLQLKRMKAEGLAKEQWAEIVAAPVHGFVGVNCAVKIKVTTLTDSWLTAKFQFDELPNDGKDLNIEIPRLPLLLSPGKSEQFIFNFTSNIELNTTLPFTIYLKDTSIDGDIAQKGCLDVNLVIPVVQAMSADGLNKVAFQPIPEKSSLTKSFVLISDCPVDLQLELSVVEGDSLFSIKNVQEVRKSEVNKVLIERQVEDPVRGKGRGMSKQLCRLTSGNAIRVVVVFNAPKLSDLQLNTKATFNGMLNVNLIGVSTVLRKVDLIGVVGTVNLVIHAPHHKLQVTNVPIAVTFTNTGSITGSWSAKCKNPDPPFKVNPSKFEIQPGSTRVLTLIYTGPEDCANETTIMFEETTTGCATILELTGGAEKPKSFPVKTNHNTLSWVFPGTKEISLKNGTDTKIHLRCHIVGEGFGIDLPGAESRGIYSIPFGARETRALPVVFAPGGCLPCTATLHLVYDKTSEFSRKIKLFGCASGEAVRWAGLVTYSDTALVRAAARQPVDLRLYNKADAPAFVCASLHLNLQYMSVAASWRLVGARRVVGARARHALQLHVPWARVEGRARLARSSALATVSVLTGGEYTRRRILRILRDEATGQLDTSLLPDHLKVLVEPFPGEDPDMDHYLKDFKETKASLNELIGGLQELTAHIDLPQDFADDNTIVISDDTVVDHHTICD